MTAIVGLACVLLGAWLTTADRADASVTVMLWLNDPPPPLNAVLAVTSPLLRPLPLGILMIVLGAWILVTAGNRVRRLEVVRALVVAVVVSEVISQVLKRVTAEPRPLSSIDGLDPHGYPGDPLGFAYPSAHTAVSVAVVCALWPWLTRTQRVVGVIVATLIAANRLYIGAHWPLDIVGGVAAGVVAGACAWLVATRWPLRVTTAT